MREFGQQVSFVKHLVNLVHLQKAHQIRLERERLGILLKLDNAGGTYIFHLLFLNNFHGILFTRGLLLNFDHFSERSAAEGVQLHVIQKRVFLRLLQGRRAASAGCSRSPACSRLLGGHLRNILFQFQVQRGFRLGFQEDALFNYVFALGRSLGFVEALLAFGLFS